MAAKDENMSRLECLKVLELDSKASEEEIKKAYKRLALLHHPDKNLNDDTSTQKFQELSDAYYKLTAPKDGHQCCAHCGNRRDCWAETAMGGQCSEDQMLFFKRMFYEVLVDFIERRKFQARKGRKRRTEEELEEEAFLDFIETLQFTMDEDSSYTDELSSDEWEFTEEELKKFHSYDEWLKDRDPKKRHNHRKRRAVKRTNQAMPTAKPKPLSKKQLQAAEHRRKKEMEEIGKKLVEQQQKLREQQLKDKQKAEKLRQEKEKARLEVMRAEAERVEVERQRVKECAETAAREAKLRQAELQEYRQEHRRKRRETKQTKKLAQQKARQQLTTRDTKSPPAPSNSCETKPKFKKLDSELKDFNNLEPLPKKKGHSQYVRNLPPRLAALKANQYKPVTKYEGQNSANEFLSETDNKSDQKNSVMSPLRQKPEIATENSIFIRQCSGEETLLSTTQKEALPDRQNITTLGTDGKTGTTSSEKYTVPQAGIQHSTAPIPVGGRYHTAPSPRPQTAATPPPCAREMAEVDHDPGLTSVHLQQYRDIMKAQPERHTQWQLKGTGDWQLQRAELIRRQQEKEAQRNRDEMDQLQQHEASMPAGRRPLPVSHRLEKPSCNGLNSSHNSTLGPRPVPNPLPPQPESAWDRRLRLLEELTPHSAEQEEAMLKQAMELSLLTEKIQRAEARYHEYTSINTRHMNDVDDFPLPGHPTNKHIVSKPFCNGQGPVRSFGKQDALDQDYSEDSSDDGLPEGAFDEAKPCPNYTRLRPRPDRASSGEEESSGSNSQTASETTSESSSSSGNLSHGRGFGGAKPKSFPQWHGAVNSGRRAQSDEDKQRFGTGHRDSVSGQSASHLQRNAAFVPDNIESQKTRNVENVDVSVERRGVENGFAGPSSSPSREGIRNSKMSGRDSNAGYWTCQEVENRLTRASSVEDWSNELDDDKIWNKAPVGCPDSRVAGVWSKQGDTAVGETQQQRCAPSESSTRFEEVLSNQNSSPGGDTKAGAGPAETTVPSLHSFPPPVETVDGEEVGISSADHADIRLSPGQDAAMMPPSPHMEGHASLGRITDLSQSLRQEAVGVPPSPPVEDLASMSRKIQGTSQIWAAKPGPEVDGSGDHATLAQKVLASPPPLTAPDQAPLIPAMSSPSPSPQAALDQAALPGLPSVLPDNLAVYMQYLAQHTALAMMSGAGTIPLVPPVPLVPGLGQLPFPGLTPIFPIMSPIFAQAMQQRTQLQAAQGFLQNVPAATNPNYQPNCPGNQPGTREGPYPFSPTQNQPAQYGCGSQVAGQPDILHHLKQPPSGGSREVNDAGAPLGNGTVPVQNGDQNYMEDSLLSQKKPTTSRFFTRINVKTSSASDNAGSKEACPDVNPPGLGSTEHLKAPANTQHVTTLANTQHIPAQANTEHIPAQTSTQHISSSKIPSRDSRLTSTPTTEVNCESTVPRRVAVQSRFCKPLTNVRNSDSNMGRHLPPRIPLERGADNVIKAPPPDSARDIDEMKSFVTSRGTDDTSVTAKYRPPVPTESWEKQRSGQTAKYRPPIPPSRDIQNGHGDMYRQAASVETESWDEELMNVEPTDWPQPNPGKTQLPRPPAIPRQFLSKGVDTRGFARLARDSGQVTARRQAAPDAFGDSQPRSY